MYREIAVHQRVYYSNREHIPLQEIAESLLALQDVIRQSSDVLEVLMPGTQIYDVQVFVNELKSNSLYEDLVVKFLFGDQQSLDECLENARKTCKLDKIMDNPKLLSAIIIVLILSGTAYALGNMFSSQEQRATIEANNNTIINIGAGMMDLDAQEFKALIDGALKDKDALAKSAAQAIRPAKKDEEATITFNDDKQLRITKESIRAAPSYVQESEEEEFIEEFGNVELEIRATDLDSGKRGWAVGIPEFDYKRVRMQLDPTVRPEELADKRTVTGDITIVFKTNKKGEKMPKLVFLRSVIEQDFVKTSTRD